MAVDRAALQKEVQDAKDRMGKVQRLKKNSTTMLRVYEFTDAEGITRFHRKVVEHRHNREGGKRVGVCRAGTFDKPCAFCRMNEKADEHGEDRLFVTRSRYYVNGTDITGRSKQVGIWGLPTTVWEAISDCVLSEGWADVLDVKAGHPFSIKSEGMGLDTEYTTTPSRNPWPPSKELLAQIRDPFEEVQDQTIEAQCAIIGCEVSDLFEDGQLEEPEEAPADDAAPAGEDIPFDAGASDDAPKPACFGDARLHNPKDKECQRCVLSANCAAAIKGAAKPAVPARQPVAARPAPAASSKPAAARPAAAAAPRAAGPRPAGKSDTTSTTQRSKNLVASLLGKKK